MKKVLFWSILIAVIVALYFFLRDTFSGHLILDPYLINTSFLHVKWYGVIIGSSVIVAYLIARSQLLHEGVKEDEFIIAMVVTIPFAVIGGRLFYVAFTWNEYFKYHVNQILEPWTGGMAIFGALIGMFFGGWLYLRLNRKASFTYLQAMDAVAMVLPFAQGMGRWGNFFNHEAYGVPTNLPWKMYVPPDYRMPGYGQYAFFTPTFLYEAIGDFLIFYILYKFTKKYRTKYGQTFALYLILYPTLRIFVESLRLDSLWFYSLRIDQVVPVIFIISGGLIFGYLKRKESLAGGSR
ncbi:prolipoprotein diacylglyceryl transferase [Athalassotoga saccharophila]|uniref:prolipoprotein diacylglyceryl transferase n=1 Tax=Athalassotoga saccharophila TaxID=1441386 RepID=UPI001379878C|nr:prolipoprotein diacylglyceryl transferase [Athalassotoga saccharophila]BBJ28922.1 prolipoprotein diacylglyceryl transferase [Athalassotoga saccharophila]